MPPRGEPVTVPPPEAQDGGCSFVMGSGRGAEAPTTEADFISEHTRRPMHRQTGSRNATRSARTSSSRHYALRAVKPSPARSDAPEPAAWLPLNDLAALPSLEELLAPENLVDSGQTIAMSAAVQALLEPTLDPDADSIAARYEARRTQSARVRSIRVANSMGARRATRLARRRRHLTLAAIVGTTVVALIVAMAGVFSAGQRDITLDLDGAARAIRTRSVTVGEFLRERGVTIADGDAVTPKMSASLASGMRIKVRRAREAVLDLDGRLVPVRTASGTLAELRAEQRIGDELVAVEGASVLDLSKPVVFRTPHAVSVSVDGATTNLDTTALTVRELLPIANITLGGNDEVTPGLDERIANGTAVSVIRLADDQRTELRSIPFTTRERADTSLPRGTRKVIQEGVAGSQRLTYRRVTRDGRVVSEQLISTVTVKEPTTRIVAVGKARDAAAAAPAPGSAANIESGQATWYDYIPGTCAHKTIPKGTVVTVVNLATGASTTCVVADRGPYAAGRIIDLTPGVFSRLAPLSSGVISVRIEW